MPDLVHSGVQKRLIIAFSTIEDLHRVYAFPELRLQLAEDIFRVPDVTVFSGAPPSQLVPELQPIGDEIVVTKTTDSALTGTNLRLILNNLGIKTVVCAGIFTDQCVASTVRSLADESYSVIVAEDCCAAATEALHRNELEIINRIYCHVMSSHDVTSYLPD